MEDIPCELRADGSGIDCQDAHCSYQEEQHRISLSVYIRSHARLEAYTKSFYLREIGKSLVSFMAWHSLFLLCDE